jgi:integral membrane sensor domain MASE1
MTAFNRELQRALPFQVAGYIVPALIGNTIGGVSLVAAGRGRREGMDA